MVDQKTVLVIESDHESRVEIRRQLERAGHFVISFASTTDPLNVIEKMTPPSLVLIAQEMPTMSGDEFVEKMRRIAGYENIPVAQIQKPGIANTMTRWYSIPANDLASIIRWLSSGQERLELSLVPNQNAEQSNL